MSDQLPSLPLFVDDYEAATAHLTIEEDGAYMRLLRLCWRTPRCSIPDDAEWIMRRMRVDQATYDRLVVPIIEEFFKRGRGRVFQKRLLQEFEYATAAKKAKKEAGKKGGIAKAQKNNENSSGNATVLPEANGKQNASPQPQPQPHSITLPNGNAAEPEKPGVQPELPVDPDKAFWDDTKAYLGKSRSGLIGKWVSEFGRDAVTGAVRAAKAEGDGAGAVDPPAFIAACLRNGQRRAEAAQREEDAAHAAFLARHPPQCLLESEWRALMGDEEFERQRSTLLIKEPT